MRRYARLIEPDETNTIIYQDEVGSWSGAPWLVLESDVSDANVVVIIDALNLQEKKENEQ